MIKLVLHVTCDFFLRRRNHVEVRYRRRVTLWESLKKVFQVDNRRNSSVQTWTVCFYYRECVGESWPTKVPTSVLISVRGAHCERLFPDRYCPDRRRLQYRSGTRDSRAVAVCGQCSFYYLGRSGYRESGVGLWKRKVMTRDVPTVCVDHGFSGLKSTSNLSNSQPYPRVSAPLRY